MPNLSELLERAGQEHWAIGHFNVSNLEMLKAVVAAAKELQAPVMIGTSEGEREGWGLKNIVALIKLLQQDWPYIFLNADHTKSAQALKLALEAGYDSVHFDGSTLPLAENIAQTRKAVEYARSINPDISVEGELGYLKGESQLSQKKIDISSADYTDPASAAEFVKSTGVNRLAIAIGNIHGINLDEPKLDFDRLSQIRAAVSGKVCLVLHAGSGINDSDIKRAIESGINNIHISTELRIVYRQALERNLKEKPTEFAPYKLAQEVVEQLQNLVFTKIKLFGSEDKSL